MFVPKKMFFTKGVGHGPNELTAFEHSLRDAGIEKFNLVSVSSIAPPGIKIVSKSEGLKCLRPGQVVFTVLARITSNEPNRLMVASVGCAIPSDETAYGYLSEFHSFGQTEKKAADHSEDLAASMLASTLGIEFDSEIAWDEKEQYFKMSGKIVKTTNITQSAECDKDGKWTTTIAAAVFIFE
jgi:arginine decarboxylase